MAEKSIVSTSISGWFGGSGCCDAVDRLSNTFTVALMTIFAAILAFQQYFGSPINCWVPDSYSEAAKQYAEHSCFSMPTLANSKSTEPESMPYHKYVPVVMALQAVLFLLPHILWRNFSSQTGIDLKGIMTCARLIESETGELRVSRMAELSTSITTMLKVHAIENRKVGCIRFGRHVGCYETIIYMGTKLLYVINAVSQFFLINHVMLYDWTEFNTLWGFEVARAMLSGRQPNATTAFPRQTVCNFIDSSVAYNVHHEVFPCTLHVNELIENLYLFLWFWCGFVATVSFISAVSSFMTIISPRCRVKTMEDYTSCNIRYVYNQINELIEREHHDENLKLFTFNALRCDGVLIFRLIEKSVGLIVTREVATQMYLDYLQTGHLQRVSSSGKQWRSNISDSSYNSFAIRSTSFGKAAAGHQGIEDSQPEPKNLPGKRESMSFSDDDSTSKQQKTTEC